MSESEEWLVCCLFFFQIFSGELKLPCFYDPSMTQKLLVQGAFGAVPVLRRV